MAREQLLIETLVALADTMVDDYDLIDFMQTLSERCVELLDVAAAGIMLADSEGRLRHVACSSEQMRLVELFELQLEEGPCLDAYTGAAPIGSESLADTERRWPRFAPYARENGFLDFRREPLMPHVLSAEGPALAVGDVDGDGLDDLYVGGGKWQPGRLLLQTPGGTFRDAATPALHADSLQEDVDASFFDADGDGDRQRARRPGIDADPVTGTLLGKHCHASIAPRQKRCRGLQDPEPVVRHGCDQDCLPADGIAHA